jgi:streptogramin lyase
MKHKKFVAIMQLFIFLISTIGISSHYHNHLFYNLNQNKAEFQGIGISDLKFNQFNNTLKIDQKSFNETKTFTNSTFNIMTHDENFFRYDLNFSSLTGEKLTVLDVLFDQNQPVLWVTSEGDPYLFSVNLTDFSINVYPTNNESITPFILEQDSNGNLWFVSYKYSPQYLVEHLVMFDIKTLEFDVYEIPTPGAATYELKYYNNRLYFTQWQGGHYGYLDLETKEVTEIKIDCGVDNCNLIGFDFTSTGELYMLELRQRNLLRIDPMSDTILDQIRLPLTVKGPVVIKTDENDNLWMGAHGGDELIKFNTQSKTYSFIYTPRPPPEGFFISGINDLRFDGDYIWMTEHFVNRFAMYNLSNGITYEYEIFRDQKTDIQWMDLGYGFACYAEYYTGIVSLFDTHSIPSISLDLKTNKSSYLEEETAFIQAKIGYVDGRNENVTLTTYVHSLDSNRMQQSTWDTFTLTLGEDIETTIEIYLAGGILPGNLKVLVGVNASDFSATYLMTIRIDKSFSSFLLPIIGFTFSLFFVMLIIVFEYQKKRKIAQNPSVSPNN